MENLSTRMQAIRFATKAVVRSVVCLHKRSGGLSLGPCLIMIRQVPNLLLIAPRDGLYLGTVDLWDIHLRVMVHLSCITSLQPGCRVVIQDYRTIPQSLGTPRARAFRRPLLNGVERDCREQKRSLLEYTLFQPAYFSAHGRQPRSTPSRESP